MRRYLANEICLFALFPRALLLNNIVVVVIIISLQYKTIQNSQIQNSTQDNESVASLSDRVIGIMNRYNAISSNVEERAQQLYFIVIVMYPKKLKEQLKNLSQVRTNLEDTGAEIDKIKANAEQMLKSNPHNRIYYFEQYIVNS